MPAIDDRAKTEAGQQMMKRRDELMRLKGEMFKRNVFGNIVPWPCILRWDETSSCNHDALVFLTPREYTENCITASISKTRPWKILYHDVQTNRSMTFQDIVDRFATNKFQGLQRPFDSAIRDTRNAERNLTLLIKWYFLSYLVVDAFEESDNAAIARAMKDAIRSMAVNGSLLRSQRIRKRPGQSEAQTNQRTAEPLQGDKDVLQGNAYRHTKAVGHGTVTNDSISSTATILSEWRDEVANIEQYLRSKFLLDFQKQVVRTSASGPGYAFHRLKELGNIEDLDLQKEYVSEILCIGYSETLRLYACLEANRSAPRVHFYIHNDNSRTQKVNINSVPLSFRNALRPPFHLAFGKNNETDPESVNQLEVHGGNRLLLDVSTNLSKSVLKPGGKWLCRRGSVESGVDLV